MQTSRLPLLTALALLLQASAAQAFTEPRTYYDSPATGGGGNRFFTGSPAEGYGCAVCHTGPGKQWPLEIKGLPDGGYEPGETYELLLRFDELAEHAREVRAQNKEDEKDEVPPAVGLVAELVAETGIGTGKLEISPADEAEDGELCELPPGARATQLYRVRPGENTREAGLSCEATSLGQRCVVATLSCGASELRVRWTAPERAQGPIWLSGGFVSAEHAAGDAENDAVQEFDHVLLPKGSSQEFATSTLESGCSAGPRRPARAYAAWLCAGLLLAGVALLRRRTRSLSALAALGLVACASDEHPRFGENEYAAHPSAGLFTPGSKLGMDPNALDAGGDGGDAATDDNSQFEDAINEASGQNRCIEREGEPGAPGTLMIEFQTETYGGHYEPENCGAVWIEDPEGQYVATPMIWAGLRARNLFIWDARRCRGDRPDAISSATLTEHGKRHLAEWDGKDQTGKLVPDGMYVLNIEVTEDEFDYGRRTEVPFERGSESFTLEPQDVDDDSVINLKLSYTPEP
jgi:hypothetical protein